MSVLFSVDVIWNDNIVENIITSLIINNNNNLDLEDLDRKVRT